MSSFKSESEMQRWMSDAFSEGQSLGDLLATGSSEISSLSPGNETERTIVSSYSNCLKAFWYTEVISRDENISIGENEILKPDFLLFDPETEGIVIVELKNLAGPTRQAGTELGAYSGEIRTALPFLSDAELVHVIVSPTWPTLLRHYVLNEILWNRRNVACLRPVMDASGKTVLEWLPPMELSGDALGQAISPRHLGGFQICLYDDDLQRGSQDRERLDSHVQQMRTALQAMAAIGNTRRANGFAFLWKDHASFSLAPYSITVLNFSPFQTIERFFHLESQELPLLVERLVGVHRDHAPEGHGNAISEVAASAVRMVEGFCSPRYEGYLDWGAHRHIVDGRAEFLSFAAWGLFQDAFVAALEARYRVGDLGVPFDCPELGMAVVSAIVNDDYQFIELGWLVDDEDEDEEFWSDDLG